LNQSMNKAVLAGISNGGKIPTTSLTIGPCVGPVLGDGEVLIAVVTVARPTVPGMLTDPGLASVAGATVAVIGANHAVGKGLVLTAQLVMTAVLGARVGIIAVYADSRDTGAIGTHVTISTDRTIIARLRVVRVDTAYARITGIVRAEVVIVTISGQPRLAKTEGTCVIHSAHLTVVTGVGIYHVETSLDEVAQIIGTGIAVVTIKDLPGMAPAIGADITLSAGVAITTQCDVGNEQAALHRVAQVIGTGIEVVAHLLFGTHAATIVTDVPQRAGITVRTGERIERILAPIVRVTTVAGADVAVVAIQRCRRLAFPTDATVVERTEILVITRRTVGTVETALLGNTGIVGTRVAIITRDLGTGHAQPLGADIGTRAEIAITTRMLIVLVGATGHGRAEIVGTYVPVVAVLGDRSDTDPTRT
jgi:hypothetical protein